MSELPNEPFDGGRHRQKESITREFAWFIRKVTAGQSISQEIPFRMAAGCAIMSPAGRTATYVALYGGFERGGVPRPIYDKDGTHLVVPLTSNAVTILPADIFPVGYLYLCLASDSNGTPTTEASDSDFIVMLKP